MADTLIIGAGGQIGRELIPLLEKRSGKDGLATADINDCPELPGFRKVDVLDRKALFALFEHERPSVVYHLAALLSATSEQNPQKAWDVNMQGFLNVLELCVSFEVKKVFWPGSIAVFGPTSPRNPAPQSCVLEPTSIYGITKLAGEQLCAYYFRRYGLDVRSLRYPGIVGYGAPPGGGTTDYAVHIYYEAVQTGRYVSFLSEDTRLPMIYAPDALRATLELMDAPAASIRIRTSYNLAGMSFTPKELAASIRRKIPDFEISYRPDFRQAIADSWPQTIDDTPAREDWGWKPEYDLDAMTDDMLGHIQPIYRLGS